MEREEFFEKIRFESGSDEEYLLNLLKLRGFLFTENEDGIMLSDNGHALDGEYLESLLTQYNLGTVKNGMVTLSGNDCTEFIENEFQDGKRISYECCWYTRRDWDYFRRRWHGYKVEVRWLEPFIARYVKAVSSCCVLTATSCDGNHPNKIKMSLQCEGNPSTVWYRLICENCLVRKFDIKWLDNYRYMFFRRKDRYGTYYEVNRAAEYLYNNRLWIRGVKYMALDNLNKKYIRSRPAGEIEQEFIENATKLFEKRRIWEMEQGATV